MTKNITRPPVKITWSYTKLEKYDTFWKSLYVSFEKEFLYESHFCKYDPILIFHYIQ